MCSFGQYWDKKPEEDLEEIDFMFCPVCGDEMNETTNESGDLEYVCSGCSYSESY